MNAPAYMARAIVDSRRSDIGGKLLFHAQRNDEQSCIQYVGSNTFRLCCR